jgi:AbrB family looped-hinge helix DNA binding protein
VEAEIATVGTKGQFVIPQRMRKELGIASKTRLAVYMKGDKLVVAKLRVPRIGQELTSLLAVVDQDLKGKRRPTEREILAEIQSYRREKRGGRT